MDMRRGWFAGEDPGSHEWEGPWLSGGGRLGWVGDLFFFWRVWVSVVWIWTVVGIFVVIFFRFLVDDFFVENKHTSFLDMYQRFASVSVEEGR